MGAARLTGRMARLQALNVWIALVERRGAWAGVRGSADSTMSGAGAAAEADFALEAAAIGGVAAHIDGLAALLAVPGPGDEHASQVTGFRVYEISLRAKFKLGGGGRRRAGGSGDRRRGRPHRRPGRAAGGARRRRRAREPGEGVYGLGSLGFSTLCLAIMHLHD